MRSAYTRTQDKRVAHGEKHVENTVDDGAVNGEGKDDGLLKEENEGPSHADLKDLRSRLGVGVVHGGHVANFSVGLLLKLGSLPAEKDRCVRLRDEDGRDDEHDGGEAKHLT